MLMFVNIFLKLSISNNYKFNIGGLNKVGKPFRALQQQGQKQDQNFGQLFFIMLLFVIVFKYPTSKTYINIGG